MAPKGKDKGKEAKEKVDPGAVARAYVSPTTPGELKSMDEPMEPAYKPHAVEASWDAWWEKSGYYKAESSPEDKRPKFSICLPPPNVTGSLHLGHALTVAVQDLLCRWHRMRGFNVLWIPGTDHAGIATQVVVEKKLKKERNQTRHDLGREAFVAEVYKWKDQYGANIYRQMHRLGCSLDWSREVFTMDEARAKAVVAAFIQFHKDGLIYRDVRLTNWCCQLRSGISDIEVEYIDITKRTRMTIPGHDKDKTYVFGVLWSFAYKLEGSDEEVVIATTRPETMLGDTAVAVHPEDPRYKQFHGKFLTHPFVSRRIPIITDSELVDMNFGTGAVKVTPAHDPNDFNCGRRHGLEEITIFTDGGAMADNCGEFTGLMRLDARVEVLKQLKAKGLYRGEKDNAMRVGTCQRTHDVIEPMLKPQWWVNCSNMAKRAADAVRTGELKITPKDNEKTWFQWLDNIRDWCVSRQLWWGHRIPAYYITIKGQPKEKPIVAASKEEAAAIAAEEYECAVGDVGLEQDEDVLDTWFSSGLFPFSCTGWPDENAADFMAWHPTTLLETGKDILFFWVARMVMCSLQLTDKLPFTDVYLHAMVRDKYGRKMSKSLGNVIDPLEVINGISLEDLQAKLVAGNLDPRELEKASKLNEDQYKDGIVECGSDALRFGLLVFSGQGADVNLDVNKVAAYSRFCNKLWNATRFAFNYMGAGGSVFRPGALPVSLCLTSATGEPRVDLPCLPDAWILSRLALVTEQVDSCLKQYLFSEAALATYRFWYNELCDVYLEAIKPIMQLDGSSIANAATKHATQTVLYTCLHYGLRLLHPFMPFVTEELFQRLQLLSGQPRSTIMTAAYPVPGAISALRSPLAEQAMETVFKVSSSIRALRASYLQGSLEKHAPKIYVVCRSAPISALISSQMETILALGRSSQSPPAAFIALVVEGCEPPRGCATEVVDADTEVHIFLKGVVDFSKEIARLQKEQKAIEGRLDKLQKKVNAPNYKERSPAAVQAEDAGKIEAAQGELKAVAKAVAAFETSD